MVSILTKQEELSNKKFKSAYVSFEYLRFKTSIQPVAISILTDTKEHMCHSLPIDYKEQIVDRLGHDPSKDYDMLKSIYDLESKLERFSRVYDCVVVWDTFDLRLAFMCGIVSDTFIILSEVIRSTLNNQTIIPELDIIYNNVCNVSMSDIKRKQCLYNAHMIKKVFKFHIDNSTFELFDIGSFYSKLAYDTLLSKDFIYDMRLSSIYDGIDYSLCLDISKNDANYTMYMNDVGVYFRQANLQPIETDIRILSVHKVPRWFSKVNYKDINFYQLFDGKKVNHQSVVSINSLIFAYKGLTENKEEKYGVMIDRITSIVRKYYTDNSKVTSIMNEIIKMSGV